jgi:hypothetical protein
LPNGENFGFWQKPVARIAGLAFDLNSFNSAYDQLSAGLFSLLPSVSSASGLKAAAAANAAVQRAKANKPYNPNNIQSAARLADQRGNNYQRLSMKLDSTVSAVTDARDTLVSLKQILSDMRQQIVLAQSDTLDDTERAKHANKFDQLLGQLNIKVQSSGGVADNLIGSSIRDVFTPGTITYKTKPDSPVDETVGGVYSGSDYYITDSSGNVFFPDLFGSQLQQFPIDDTAAGQTVSATDTVDYNSDTGAISITHAGDTDPFISGTLTRKGLGVLHSFLYNDFQDSASRDQALSDLDAASAKLRFNIAVIEGQLTKVTAQRDFNTKLINENQALASKVQDQQAADNAKQSLEAQRQNLLFAKAFQSTASFDGSGSLLSLAAGSNLFDFSA